MLQGSHSSPLHVLFQGQFYSRSSVCVSLHITQEATPGWEYSVAVFHGLNFFTFIFIFVAYSYMYSVIRGLESAASAQQKKREMTAARKMTLIVVTDFMCWVPINIMGKNNSLIPLTPGNGCL